MFHLNWFGEGPVGYNVVEYAAQSIGWARASELFGATFFGEGMNPSGVIEPEHDRSRRGQARRAGEHRADRTGRPEHRATRGLK